MPTYLIIIPLPWLYQGLGFFKSREQDIEHILISNLVGYQYRQAFLGVFINDIQYLKGSSVSCAVYIPPL
jgi:hypothetical protein